MKKRDFGINRWIALLAISLFFGAFGSCSHTPQPVPSNRAGFLLKKPITDYPYTEIQEGKGLVIFIRPAGPIGLSYWEIAAAATTFTVFANKEKLGPLPTSSYRLYHANPGQNTFFVKAPLGRPRIHSINIEPEKVYFLLAITKRGWAGKVKTQFISLEDGQSLIKECEEVKGEPKKPEEDT